MTPVAALVDALRDRGVTFRVDGETVYVKPVAAVTPGELAVLRERKAEVRALLAARPTLRMWVDLDPVAVRETLGDPPDQHSLACVRFDVLAAVHELETGIASGVLPARRVVWGKPLADWLTLDALARLLGAGVRGSKANG